jgi:Fe-S-cluster containining protein
MQDRDDAEERPEDLMDFTDRPPVASRDEFEDGLVHVLHQLQIDRLGQSGLEATVRALLETLLASGVLDPDQFEHRRQKALDRATEKLREAPVVKLGKAVDKYALTVLPEIDCASLLHLCKARCCRLSVYLSAQDLDERELVWDYGTPYRLKKGADGYCAHHEADTHRCRVYGRRPATCRTYDCRNDARIWQDFERRIPQD